MSKRPRDLSTVKIRNIENRTRAPLEPGPRPLTIKPTAADVPAPSRPAPKQRAPSRLPLIALALIALLGFGATSVSLMIHIMTGGKQTDFSEEILAQDLVPVEPTAGTLPTDVIETDQVVVEDPALEEDTVDMSTPTLIALRGDPIIVNRQKSVARQLKKVDGEQAKSAAQLKLPGEVYRLSDNLGAAAGSFATGAPGSQLGFAFTQPDGEGEDDENASAPTLAESENATMVTVNTPEDGAGPSRIVFTQMIEAEMPVSAALAAGGFDAEMSKLLETEVKRQLNADKLNKSLGIAVVGLGAGDDGTGFVPVQFALFKDGMFVGALAISEVDSYVQAANPWYGQDPFQAADEAQGGGKQRLLDVIYGAAVRNELPTTVAGEIIMLLSRKHDLEQSATGIETIQVLYASKARDRKSGLGKVLYVRVERGTEDALECFSFQLQPKKPFECITGAGDGATTGGMTTPIRGVLDRKFGPGKDPVTKKKRMFYGVEWIAPPGTAVVAAFAGKVVFAGRDPKLGNIVKLSHDGGQMTLYGKLKAVADGMTEGRAVRAGQRLGTVGLTEGASDSRLYFELQRGRQPVDPFGEYQARVEKGTAVDSFVYRITTIESGNNCKAKNPLSTAAGLGQFIESTWLRILRDYRPDLVAGRSRSEILDLRYDCAIALAMTTALTRENASYIRSRGHIVTPGNLYLAHFLGPGGAATALGTPPDAPVLNVFGASVVRANPFLEGRSTAWLIEWAAKKMAGKGKAPVIAASQGTATAKAQSLAANKDFVKFRNTVMAMLD
jgi:murein DD-endopeptidase MepM/ murein hydrolase activator NlpD